MSDTIVVSYPMLSLDVAVKREVQAGMRIARIIRKNEKKEDGTVVVRDSTACFLPSVAWAAVQSVIDNPTMQDAILDMVEAYQNKLIRTVDDNKRSPCAVDVDMTAVLELMEQEAEENGSSRLTKESIGAWVDSSIADTLTVAFAEKLGIGDTPTEAEAKKLQQVLKGYKDKLAMLAGGKTSFEVAVVEKLQGALKYAPEGDVMAARLGKKLAAMSQKQADDLMALE